MAYPRPQLNARSPPAPLHHEPHRSSWDMNFSSNSRPLLSNSMQTVSSAIPPPDPMDPESSDSDVSVTPADNYRYGSPPAIPAAVPPPPPKMALESSDAVQNRLRELSRVEDHNIKKQERLQAKRRRRADKIARKREIQDRKIKAIMDARERRDARIRARQAREDASFRKVDDQLEEEEMSLRRRLKRLKRGLPLDESPQLGRTMSSASSMSPPAPQMSTIPPPAKRHQSGPPGQPDGYNPVGPPPPQSNQQHPLPPSHSSPPAPQYSFYQSNPQQPYSVPYHSNSPYNGPSNNAPPVPLSGTSRPPTNAPNERNQPIMNGRPPSPLSRPGPLPTSAPNTSSTTTATPRQSSSYDTRPPPATSGFASINAPPSSGFAAINPRTTATPPVTHAGLAPSENTAKVTPISARVGDTEGYGYSHTPNSATIASIPSTGKRTPSTTHPYQMSEAFANRHHHCERVDSLNRGIWTSYGPMGTQEAPTGSPVEMYLRCNHDDCRRIDWRTVHGLQCHIVKNHEQPKGTIGSLEKALDRYGVPVSEVEEYEREHGEGTSGTMADPKNLKIKTKTREASVGRGPLGRNTPGSYGIDPNTRPAGYKPSPTPTVDSPTISSANGVSPKYHSPAVRYPPSSNPPGKNSPQAHAAGLSGRPEPARSGWTPVGSGIPPPPPHGYELSKLQGDEVMREAPQMIQTSPKRTEGSFWRTWPASPPKTNTQQPNHSPYMTAPPLEPPRTGSFGEHTRPRPLDLPVSSPQVTRQTPPVSPQTPRAGASREIQHEKNENLRSPISIVKPPTPVAKFHAESPRNELSKPPAETMVNGEKIGNEQQTSASKISMPSSPAVEKNEQETTTKQEKSTEKEEHYSKGTITPGGPASGRRSTLQSPVMTTKPLNPPGSVKRGSRRSSTVRKVSLDGNTEPLESVEIASDNPKLAEKETAKSQAAATSKEPSAVKDAEKIGAAKEPQTPAENNEEEDGDSITVASSTVPPNTVSTRKEDNLKEREREPARTPPRRNTAGRFTRNKSRAG